MPESADKAPTLEAKAAVIEKHSSQKVARSASRLVHSRGTEVDPQSSSLVIGEMFSPWLRPSHAPEGAKLLLLRRNFYI